MIEIEVKFRISDIAKIRKALKRTGAKRIGKVLQEDFALDDEGETLARSGKLLRLRKAGDKVYLAFKSLRRRGKFKEAEEVEIEVSDFEKAKELLGRLGFSPKGKLRKQREEWSFGSSEILIDQSVLGSFLEIEGSREEIEKIVRLLGLDRREGSTKTYEEIYQEYCKKRGIKAHPRFIVLPKDAF